MNEIKVVKLISGEEIVGMVEVPTEENMEGEQVEAADLQHLLFIRSPMRIVYEYDANRVPHVFLYDWMPSAEDDFYPIQKHHVVTVVEACSSLKELYFDIHASRLAIAGGSLPTDTQEEREAKAIRKMLEDAEFDDEDMQ